MDKKTKRKKQLSHLKDFAKVSDKEIEDQKLAIKFFDLKEVKTARNIGVYFSIEHEINTMPIIEGLRARKKKLYLPKVVPGPEHSMNFIRYTEDSKLETSSFGIKEIVDSDDINNDIDLLLVPGIAFSVNKHFRLGYGGGYYDRFLQRNPKIMTVSLVNSQMLFNEADWSIEDTDIPIDILISID